MLTLIVGIPNAGKTTYSQRFDNVIHLDEVGFVYKVCDIVSTMDGDVVVEGVFYRTEQRRRLINAYNGDRKRCIFLDIPLEESIKREDRNRPEWMLKNAFRFLQPPTLSEGWDEIIVIRENNHTATTIKGATAPKEE